MSALIFDSVRLSADLAGTELAPWAAQLGEAVSQQEHALKHGHLPKWENAIARLPDIPDCRLNIIDGVVTIDGPFDSMAMTIIQAALSDLIPWRKGPFKFGDLSIDTEWRSDWKWDRLENHIQALNQRVVLDVGCGSGYHLWRMRAAGAKQGLGIDPSLLYLKQFDAVQYYVNDAAVQFLPLPMEALPESMQVFDTVFSMGVLYHRRDPGIHLEELRRSMKPGGELVLETLVAPGEENSSIKLDTRYANMRNIYELPTISTLEEWLARAGFGDIRTVSINTTSRSEQRTTEWMPSHSLNEALDPNNKELTIEGHPRPLRAIVVATYS